MKPTLLVFAMLLIAQPSQSQNVGIGTVTPTKSKLVVVGISGNAQAIFGDGQAGVSLESNQPLVGFNNYYFSGRKYMIDGYAGGISMSNFTGDFSIISYGTGSQGGAVSTNNTLMTVLQAGNVGIGNATPWQAGLVVDTKAGATNAMFGSNTTGVSIETSYPGIAFNTYYNGGRRNINTGFGSLVGQDPSTGRFYISTSAASVTGQGTSIPLYDRLVIDAAGNIGVEGNNAPTTPLSFANTVGNKIALFGDGNTGHYGLGIQGALMQLYTNGSTGDIAFGFGSSSSFTEKMRVRGNGNVGIGIVPTEKFEIRTAVGEIGWKHSWAGGSLVSTAPTLITAAAIRSNSAALQLTTNSNVGLYIKTDGTIGAGLNNPTRPLDVTGRMRIRGTVNDLLNSAGIYFDGPTDIERAFIGIETNDKIGIYGIASGWGLSMNVTTGNTNLYNKVAIGTAVAPNSNLQVVGSVSMPFIRLNDADYGVTDNDYTIFIALSAATGLNKNIVLPTATGRAGRIYVIAADIPYSGAGTYSKVNVLESGTGINVIAGSKISQSGVGSSPYLCYTRSIFVIGNYNRILHTKQTSITVQSDGTSWKIISNDFSTFDINDYFN